MFWLTILFFANMKYCNAKACAQKLWNYHIQLCVTMFQSRFCCKLPRLIYKLLEDSVFLNCINIFNVYNIDKIFIDYRRRNTTTWNNRYVQHIIFSCCLYTSIVQNNRTRTCASNFPFIFSYAAKTLTLILYKHKETNWTLLYNLYVPNNHILYGLWVDPCL